MARTRCDRTPAWTQLQAAYAATGQGFDVRQAFAQDAQRFERFSQSAPLLFADLSKNRIDASTEALLMDLARQSGVQAHRDAMFAGEKINATEGREVWHVLLRAPAGSAAAGSHKAAELAKVHARCYVGLCRHGTCRYGHY
jgi:glucose-6-phosphate isomerase